ncbi:MAG: class I SAM-dependent methyltransferase, partial [Candidatus Micrarchaeota archaeon]
MSTATNVPVPSATSAIIPGINGKNGLKPDNPDANCPNASFIQSPLFGDGAAEKPLMNLLLTTGTSQSDSPKKGRPTGSGKKTPEKKEDSKDEPTNKPTKPDSDSDWHRADYVSVDMSDEAKLYALEKKARKRIKGDLPKDRDFEDDIYKQYAILYYQTTDAKEKVAFILKSFVIPNLARRHNLRLTALGCGEGSFACKIAGRVNTGDFSRQSFNEVFLIDKSHVAIEYAKKLLSSKFTYVSNPTDTRAFRITKEIREEKEKIPLKYSFKLATFPDIAPDILKADLVILNHMLHYNDY